MKKLAMKLLVYLLSFCLVFPQAGFAQLAARPEIPPEAFRPLHLRSLEFDPAIHNFSVIIDKGTRATFSSEELRQSSKELLDYFLVGLSLPNDTFWVNLRPDSPDRIIDQRLARTEIGKVFLEADLELKKDTALAISPRTPEGALYWDRLQRKGKELFGQLNSISTLSRPWIVPGDIILLETGSSAYVAKATLQVRLEEDRLQGNSDYGFQDARLRELNAYSAILMREHILPALNKKINTSRKYAHLRQVYYSLILSQWFKSRYALRQNPYSSRIDSGDLTGLQAKTAYSPRAYFEKYRTFFESRESEQRSVVSESGVTTTSYCAGGILTGDLVPPKQGQAIRTLGNGEAVSVPVIEAPAVPDSAIKIAYDGGELAKKEENSKVVEFSQGPRWEDSDYKLHVFGNTPLIGEVEIGGSKHSVVPLMGALLLCEGTVHFNNFPGISDAKNMSILYEKMGVQEKTGPNSATFIIPEKLNFQTALEECKNLRGSILLLGSALLRSGKEGISFPLPGGDEIGRNFAKHFEIIQAFGYDYKLSGSKKKKDRILTVWPREKTTIRSPGMIDMMTYDPADPGLDYSGAYTTALAMILAAGVGGKTTVQHALKTSDTMELGRFLQKMGVRVEWEVLADDKKETLNPSVVITSPGMDKFKKNIEINHEIDPDKAEIVFWITAAIMSGGVIDIDMHSSREFSLDNFGPLGEFYRNTLEKKMGMTIEETGKKNVFRVDASKTTLKSCELRATNEGNGANIVDPMMNLLPLLTIADGESKYIDEKHGWWRFNGMEYMRGMGAKIEMISEEKHWEKKKKTVEGVKITGVKKGTLKPSGKLKGSDIRDAANLFLLALGAPGESVLSGFEHIERAYEYVFAKLSKMGCNVRKINLFTPVDRSVTDADLEKEMKYYLAAQRYGATLDKDEPDVFIKTIINTFGGTIRDRLPEPETGRKTIAEVMAGDDDLREAITVNALSRMFRYEDHIAHLMTESLDTRLDSLINAVQAKGEKQTLEIGIIGPSYGQELISFAVLLRQRIEAKLYEHRLPLKTAEDIETRFYLMDKPGLIFTKLSQNQVYYPAELRRYEELKDEDAVRLLTPAEKGLKRSEEFNKHLVFREVDLLDQNTFPEKEETGEFDVLLVNNVLHYVSAAAHEKFTAEETMDKIHTAEDFISKLVKQGGAILAMMPGDDFFEGKKTPPPGFISIEKGAKDEYLFVRKDSSTAGMDGGTTGGIDFRLLPIVRRAKENIALNVSRMMPLNRPEELNQEEDAIEKLVRMGVRPSTERIYEFVRISCRLERPAWATKKIIKRIMALLREEEIGCFPTDQKLVDALIVLESTRSTGELMAVFCEN